ncbi:hypothetical protein EJB05_54273 [Eragrostis curvula]|uniref:T-complex protein 11 n=1 Tax=Eragrostis curvula TaxID=38414 RepID=A0A5J9SMT5_9POAL|nr:hypothetical protein EJB05_54273 [Eragrostis curvula]
MVTREPVAMEIPAEEGPAARAPPRRIRMRLMEGARGGGAPASVEEIEARLREAEHRRQDLGNSLVTTDHLVLRRSNLAETYHWEFGDHKQFHEWLACKARKKPRSPSWSSQEEDHGQRLEAKLQAAEQKRLSLLAKAQKRLAKLDELRQAARNDVEMRFEKEREELETRVESRVRQAEENRMRLLHAHMQKRAALKERIARSLVQKATSESNERRKLKEQLDNKLQRAKRQRAEYLKQRGSPRSSAHADYIKHADFLSRKLARCWRRFVKSKKTTLALVQAYHSLGINEKSVNSMPFEKLAMSMESPAVLQAAKALLDRLETRLMLSQSAGSSPVENVDHLLKRVGSPPKRKVPPSREGRSRVSAKRPARNTATSKLPRYSLRVVLCAYMILAHPSAVLSGQGQREKQLMESAASFVKEFELLIKIVLDGPGPSSLSTAAAGSSKFRTQLANFDKAWCTYLYSFVVWKVKDARSLEEDLVRAACKLELSMMQTCKLTAEGQSSNNLTHDMKAIQKQVTDDQMLLREKVQHLSGDAGIERMNSAISDTRSKFFEAKENGSPLATPVANVSTPLSINSPGQIPLSKANDNSREASSSVVRSLFGSSSSAGSASQMKLPTENEQMVNELLHEDSAFVGKTESAGTAKKDFEAKVRETMEKAFWDVVTDSMKGDKPDYGQLVNLVKEVRDSLHELAPKGWKEEIMENIDLEILSQVLESGSQDAQYLGQILQYSLNMVRKLSAPAKEDEMKKNHDKLLSELAASSEVDGSGISSFVIVVIKGLRFILEEIKELQAEVSKARIQLMQPIIKGSAGVEYLQKAFADRFGPPANASASLPLTLQWISTSKNTVEQEWGEHLDSLATLPSAGQTPALLRAGHGAPAGQPSSSSAAGTSGQPECKGEKLDKLIRIGLLQLVSGTEGLQMQSTPESFQVNLLRLRAVQGQFQQVIVIATSMLVLRQVLMSENSKPLEVENAVSGLFEALVKLLDNSPDAGTEEIVEAMMSSSASVGSPSNDKIQTRRQIITRVFLKSLQPDDAVFKKVSRSVYCAFRGVVLGGSGPKGQKLADAVLRRIGAAKLVDRVVKASEVLIKVATVSEKVHGPWYQALM